jgi:adenine-specific DNA-methyltransferase
MASLLNDLKDALSTLPNLVNEDGELIRARVEERAMKLDADLLGALTGKDSLRAAFFQDVGGTLVFDKVRFTQTVTMRDFLPDSFTAYGNKIGLTAAGEALRKGRDVVLDWPYKDCVLAGGMTREDRGGPERFINRIVAPDEVIRLEEPKALTGWERWDADAVAAGKPGTVEEASLKGANLLLKGNNLFALHSLKAHLGRRVATEGVKLIYIDPPYNTGNDGFRYNDRFTHSTWLTFMRNRLEVARDLLRDDGAIFVNLDDGEAHYCKVLMDEIFGRDSFLATVIWRKNYSPNSSGKDFSKDHDYILIYSRKTDLFVPNLMPRTDKTDKAYKNPDKDPRGPWKTADLSARNYYSEGTYSIQTPSGRLIDGPPNGRYWSVSEANFRSLVNTGQIWWGKKNDAIPQRKKFLSEVKDGINPQTIWHYDEVGHTQEAKQELIILKIASLFATPKPEYLIHRIIHIATTPGDLVLDFFAGSGTTAAVAHKMGRRWIAVEQMDYVRDLTTERLKKVVSGEQGGISKAVEWPDAGGGSFLYAELASEGQDFVARLDMAEDDALDALRDELATAPFLRHEVDPEALNAAGWGEQSPSVKRRALREAVSADHLYVSVGDMDDAAHGLSQADRSLSRAFYGIEGAAE